MGGRENQTPQEVTHYPIDFKQSVCHDTDAASSIVSMLSQHEHVRFSHSRCAGLAHLGTKPPIDENEHQRVMGIIILWILPSGLKAVLLRKMPQ